MVQAWFLGTNTQANKVAAHSTYKKSVAGRIRPDGRAQARAKAAGWKAARAVFLLFAFAVLFAGFSLMRSFADESAIAPATAEERVITADAGDSLWTIAERIKPEGMDTRDAIYRIMKRNGLVSSNIRSGESLIIPAGVWRG